MKKKGFTLIELMIVVAIIAILAAAALPSFGDQIKKSKDGKAVQMMGTIRSQIGMAIGDLEGQAPTNLVNVLNGGRIEANGDASIWANTRMIQGWNKTVNLAAAGMGGTMNAGTPTTVQWSYTITTWNDGNAEFTTTTLDTKGKNWNSY